MRNKPKDGLGKRIGEMLKYERTKRGMSVEEWAAMVGITTERVKEIEAGEDVDLHEMGKFRKCGVDLNQITDKVAEEGYFEGLTEEDALRGVWPDIDYGKFQMITAGMNKKEKSDFVTALLFADYNGLLR